MSNVADFLVNLMQAGDCEEQVPDVRRVQWITKQLEKIGCNCDYQFFTDTANVYAEIGDKYASRSLCFCGHCDVVLAKKWTKNPSGEIVGDRVYGRGAVDMLGAVACWYEAMRKILEEDKFNGKKLLNNVRISMLLTGDEEGAGTHGTNEMVDYLQTKSIKIDACIVGEPTSDYRQFGDYSENIDNHKLDGVCYSRGGSFHFWIKVKGKSGHIAYVGEFDNPITKAVKLCDRLKQLTFDEFDKMTNLEIVEFKATNDTDNVILDQVKIHGNIRFFNDPSKKVVIPETATLIGTVMFDARLGEQILRDKIENVCKNILGNDYEVRYQCDRVGYATKQDDAFLQLVMSCMQSYNDKSKFVITRGCTDGEYMTKIAKRVCELGLKCKMMHKVDEYTTLQDLEDLTTLYYNIIKKYITTTLD